MRDLSPVRLAAVVAIFAVAPPLHARVTEARAPLIIRGRVTDGAQVMPRNVYLTSSDAYPLYTQHELSLIRAEPYERRFGRISEARATWLPYPAQEKLRNPNPPTTP